MTIGWMCAVTVLCAVLYLLGWERGHRGATVWRSVKRALAARRQRLERAAPGKAGRGAAGTHPVDGRGAADNRNPAGRNAAGTKAAGTNAAGRGAADNRNPAGRNAAGTNAAGRGAADNRNPAGRNAAGADPAQAGAGTQAGRNTGEPANGRALQELLNFLQYDGTPQPPPGGHNR